MHHFFIENYEQVYTNVISNMVNMAYVVKMP